MNKFPEDPKAPAVKTQRLNYERVDVDGEYCSKECELKDCQDKNCENSGFHYYNVISPKGFKLGEIWPPDNSNFFFFRAESDYDINELLNSRMLRELADQLDRLNKDWHDHLMRRIK